MVVLENSHIIGLTANEALIKEFPFLSIARDRLRTPSSSCCGGHTTPSVDFNGIKMNIATMPNAAKVKFKEITGWDKIKIIYWTGNSMQTTVI